MKCSEKKKPNNKITDIALQQFDKHAGETIVAKSDSAHQGGVEPMQGREPTMRRPISLPVGPKPYLCVWVREGGVLQVVVLASLADQLSGGGGDEEEEELEAAAAVSSLRSRRRLSSAALGSPPSAPSPSKDSLLSSIAEEEVEEYEEVEGPGSASWGEAVAPPTCPSGK